MQAGGHEFESRILHADNKSCEIQQRHPIVLAQMRMWMVDFIGRKSVIEMKRSGIEIHDDCLSCTLKIAYKKKYNDKIFKYLNQDIRGNVI